MNPDPSASPSQAKNTPPTESRFLNGLDETSAAQRLAQFGPNEIRKARTRSPAVLFLLQFKSPLVALLIVASAVSAVLGEWIEYVAIGVILILNAAIGFFQ